MVSSAGFRGKDDGDRDQGHPQSRQLPGAPGADQYRQGRQDAHQHKSQGIYLSP